MSATRSTGAVFHDRADAGRELGERLSAYRERADVVVLGLARGGVPVAYEVAEALEAPLDVFVVRKLGVPRHPELAFGAIASGGVQVLNDEVLRALDIDEHAMARVVDEEQRELERREEGLRGRADPLPVDGRTAILVDDGLATGASMRAAVLALRRQEAGGVVVAVPVAAPEVCADFEDEVDEIICAHTPAQMYAVGAWYADFRQTSEDEVRELVSRRRRRVADQHEHKPST